MILKVTFSDEEIAAIDRLRGGVPKATWVRIVVREAALAANVLEEHAASSDRVAELSSLAERTRALASPGDTA